MSTTHPRVLAMQDALRAAGIRTKLTQQFERGGPDLLVGKGGVNKPLLWVSRNEIDPRRVQTPQEIERYTRWWNDSSSPIVAVGKLVSSPAEAVAAANFVVNPADGLPTVVVAPPPGPTGTADAFQNAFKHSLFGQWNNFLAVDASRFILSEKPRSGGFGTADSVFVNCTIENGDSPAAAEFYNADSANGKIPQANDTADISLEVSFPADFPTAPTLRCSFSRLSAFTNGVDPLQFLVRKNGAGVDTLYLRENGATHDLASQTTLDAAGGYIWSTPLLRATNYGEAAMNWFRLTLRVFFSTTVGWVELYRDYNMTTPVMARVSGIKTLTDTSGTVKDIVRYGLNRNTGITGKMRVMLKNCRYTITRPP